MKTERKSCPNGKGVYAFLPETDLCHVFTLPGGVQMLSTTYAEGVEWANAHGCDFPLEQPSC